MDFVTQMQILALSEVMSETAEWHYRHCCRWYSSKYATPLHFVTRLPEADVYQAYFEDHYEEFDAEQRDELRRLLTETETQRMARLAAENEAASSDAAFEAMADAEAKRLESTQIPAQEPVRPVQHPHKPRELPEAMLEGGTIIPADVQVKFVDDNFFEDLLSKLDTE